MKESHPAEMSLRAIEPTATTEVDGHEAYEQGSALKNVGLFRQAAEHFEKAAQDSAYALKGLAQMGLCLKQSGKQEEAVAAFRRALQIPTDERLLCKGLAIGGVYSSAAQRLNSHGDVTILRCFTPEPSIGLQRFRNAPDRL